MKTKTMSVLLALFMCITLPACETAKKTGKLIGHTARDTTKAIGHATRDAVKSADKEISSKIDEE